MFKESLFSVQSVCLIVHFFRMIMSMFLLIYHFLFWHYTSITEVKGRYFKMNDSQL